MQKRKQILVLAFIFLAAFIFTPAQVRADEDYDPDECLQVEITYAYYLDCDSDKSPDDILTVFTIEPTNDKDAFSRWRGITEISCLLESPSDIIYTINFETNLGEGIRVAVQWLNCAAEEGSYRITVTADPIGAHAPDEGCDQCVFDPPKGSPAPPVIQVVCIEPL